MDKIKGRKTLLTSKKAVHGNVTKSESVTALDNHRSLASLFRIQQERWDAKFENIPAARVDEENSSHVDSTPFVMEQISNFESGLHASTLDTKVVDGQDFEEESSRISLCSSITGSEDGDVKLKTTKSQESDTITNSTNHVLDGAGCSLCDETDAVVSKELSTPQALRHSTSRLSLKRKITDCSSDAYDPIATETSTGIHLSEIILTESYPTENLLQSYNTGEQNLNDNSQDKMNSAMVANGHDDFDQFPYYLQNFLTILDGVIADEYYSQLFDDEDLQTVDLFRNVIDEDAQKLYVRLFLRKNKWLMKCKIEYKKISSDLTSALDQLTACGLLMDDSAMNDLEDVIRCLSAPDLKSIAKTIHLNSTTRKPELINAILSHARARSNIGNFLGQPANATEKLILMRSKKILGRCYKLNGEKRFLFARVMMLFGLHNTINDDDNAFQSQQLFQMLLNQIGELRYPDFTVRRSSKVFKDRDSLIRYARALQYESDMNQAMEQKDYAAAFNIYSTAKLVADRLLSDQSLLSYDSELPVHLRQYTASAVYVRLLTHGVEVLQFLKLFEEAVTQLRSLVSQQIYESNRRGFWYDRLALNIDYHLKQSIMALEVIKTALQDPFVRTGRRLSLLLRAKKICNSSTAKRLKTSLWNDFKEDVMNDVQEAPKITITGRQLSHTIGASTPLWVGLDGDSHDASNVMVMTRVEDVALKYYADNGYPQGIHGEGSTFRTLYSLFMWDILFLDDVNDVFYNRYQTAPLDLLSDNFYVNRARAFDQRLQLISDMSTEELSSFAANTWTTYKDVQCATISWDRFRDCKHMTGLVSCLNGITLAGIFNRMTHQMRQVSGGVPDLVVWNPSTRHCKVVEVKGPGDRLSTKQILWLDYLLQLGVDAEVCHVQAVGCKRLTTTQKRGASDQCYTDDKMADSD